MLFSLTMNNQTFVATIDINLAEKLKADLIQQGFIITKPPYTIFSAKKKGVSCTLYTSGKLTVQGKEKHDFIAFYLEPEILKVFTYSHPQHYIDKHARIGIDEAGKGDYFGPLCVSGVYADEKGIAKLLSLGIRDSKKLSDNSVKKLAEKIGKEFPYSLVKITPETYNKLYSKFKNLNSLLAWAHATAIEKLYDKTKCTQVTIDQFAHESVVKKAVQSKNLPIHLTQRHKGEEDPVVAAASIIARSNFLTELDKLSQSINIQLPKGASGIVQEKAQKIVNQYGPDILQKIAKLHFKTTNEILNQNN
ncbi:MAG: ribonuclease HIII [Simkaniaceae bacterium]